MMMMMIRMSRRRTARTMAAISPVESPELTVEAPVFPDTAVKEKTTM